MDANLLFDFLVTSGKLSEEVKDCIRYDILSNIYCFGDHNASNPERKANYSTLYKQCVLDLAKKVVVMNNVLSKRNKSEIPISSSAYWGFGNNLKALGYNTSTPPWMVSRSQQYLGSYDIFKQCASLKKDFVSKDFNELISSEYVDIILKFKGILTKYFVQTKHKALFLPQDQAFFENLSIKIFKEIGAKSFVYMHGFPARYNDTDENRSDYLLVLGEGLKRNYVRAGIDANKIIVIGHPWYHSLKSIITLKNSLDDILVMSSPIPGKPSNSIELNIGDRTNNLYYLYSIQFVLKKMGIKKARLRCHPGENIKWYKAHIDRSFYIIDTLDLKSSFKKATLIIGNTSTSFFESIFYGVNYIVFEPLQANGRSLSNNALYPPFDGSDGRVPVCHTIEDLEKAIKDRLTVKTDILNDYFNVDKPFNISILKDLIG